MSNEQDSITHRSCLLERKDTTRVVQTSDFVWLVLSLIDPGVALTSVCAVLGFVCLK